MEEFMQFRLLLFLLFIVFLDPTYLTFLDPVMALTWQIPIAY